MTRFTPARHRVRLAWVTSLLLVLALASCWKVEADLVVSTQEIDFAGSKETNGITIRNDSENNSLTSGVVTLEYKLKSDKAWLTVAPSSGSCGAMEKHSHTVAVDRSLMGYGDNLGNISITSNGGSATIKVHAIRSVPGCDKGPTGAIAVTPLSGASGVPVNVQLAWSDGESQCPELTATYDVYFGTTSPPPFDHNNESLKVWNSGPLAANTTYFWRIVVKDANGEIKGPQWTFQTVCDLTPSPVTLLAPADNATNVSVNDDLSWGGGVSQCAGLTSSYDVYFGTTSPPPFHHNMTGKYWDPGVLAKETTYYWKVVAKDSHGTSASPVRSFTTIPLVCTLPPTAVSLVAPGAEAEDIPLEQDLSWSGGDSQCAGKTATYDVYFGTVSPAPFHHNNGGSKTWDPGQLQYDTIYYWRVVAKDDNGAQTSSERWFRTPCHLTPGAISVVAPPNAATGVNVDADLSWGGGNSRCPGLSSVYDVYFGTTSSPPLVASNGTLKYWDPGTLARGVTYYWRIVAKDANGQTSGPVWTFRTEEPLCTGLPTAACEPSPSNLKDKVNRDSDLAWKCGDSQCGLAVTYDVYLGTIATPGAAQLLGTTASRSWTLPRLQSKTKYYWKVITHDANGVTSSPVWSFTVM